MLDTPWGPWDPMTPREVGGLLAGLDAPWWIAGGYAIEAFVARAFREHGDVDVGLLRRDQLLIQKRLDDWDLHAADPPGTLRPWVRGESLPLGVHDIWARRGAGRPWRFQLMLNESEGDDWLYRRDPRIRRALGTLVWPRDGISYLAPEVQLLFKAKAPRAKDEADFEAALPLLDKPKRLWLSDALALTEPANPWINWLTEQGEIR
ncbi:MAG: amino acid transporter [Anaerolineaceae bacterium]